MQDIDKTIEGFSPNRDHSFKIRDEIFHGRLGIDYVIVTNYYAAASDLGGKTGGGFQSALESLLSRFLGSEEYGRFDLWRTHQREAGNPLTIFEASLIAAAIVEEETARPTRASSDSSTGREKSGDGSTADSSSQGTTEAREASLSVAS